jgi:hypothetical protein
MTLSESDLHEATEYNARQTYTEEEWTRYMAHAVAAHQAANGLTEDGMLGPNTRASLDALPGTPGEPQTPPPVDGEAPPPARLKHSGCPLTRGGGRAYMASELTHPDAYPERPFPGVTASTTGRQRAHAVTEWLNPEDHERHLKIPGATFCNVYAHDAGEGHQHPVRNASGEDPGWRHGHLPRTWWNNPASAEAAHGDARYGETCSELNANGLCDWIAQHAQDYGWINPVGLEPGAWTGAPRSSEDAMVGLQEAIERHTATQEAEGLNGYAIGVICTRQANKSHSGHVCMVLPELGDRRAGSKDGYFSPLMSQAGTTNMNFFTDSVWFRSSSYDLLTCALVVVPHRAP